MPTSKLYEVIIRAAKNGDVRRVVAEALFTLVVIVARSYSGGDDEEP